MAPPPPSSTRNMPTRAAGDFVVTLEVVGPAGHVALSARLGRIGPLVVFFTTLYAQWPGASVSQTRSSAW